MYFLSQFVIFIEDEEGKKVKKRFIWGQHLMKIKNSWEVQRIKSNLFIRSKIGKMQWTFDEGDLTEWRRENILRCNYSLSD